MNPATERQDSGHERKLEIPPAPGLGLVGEPLATVAFVFTATTALAQPFYVPSGSMEPTLQIGDAFLGSKFAYGYSRYSMPIAIGPHSQRRLLGKLPNRGDVVVFRHPRDAKETLVKRVIGLPGDTVQMVHGRLVINGHMLPLERAGSASWRTGWAPSSPSTAMSKPCRAGSSIRSSNGNGTA